MKPRWRGRTYLRLVDRLHTDGWRVELIYLVLPSVEMSKLRVAERVAHGGHNIHSAALSAISCMTITISFCLRRPNDEH